MKVIQILPELNSGGVERGTLEISQQLVACGHESIVVSNGGRLVEQLERQGSRHILLPVHKKSLASLRQVSRLRKLFENEAPDIIHLRSRVPAWLSWLAWRKMPLENRPRLLTTVHGFYSVNAYSRIMTRGERVIAVSESVKDYILENYPKTPSERIRVIHRGVSPELFPYDYQPDVHWLKQWKTEHPELEGKRVITLPARITRWKGQEDFLQIIKELDDSSVPVCGLLPGAPHPRKEPFFQELKNRVAEMGLTGKIVFLGHRSDLREIMAVSDIVLSLSSDPEAFGRISLEALSLGRPVIGYNHGGVAEQLAHLLPEGAVPVGDYKEVAKRIKSWNINPPKPARNNPFTLHSMQEKTLSVYQELAGKENTDLQPRQPDGLSRDA